MDGSVHGAGPSEAGAATLWKGNSWWKGGREPSGSGWVCEAGARETGGGRAGAEARNGLGPGGVCGVSVDGRFMGLSCAGVSTGTGIFHGTGEGDLAGERAGPEPPAPAARSGEDMAAILTEAVDASAPATGMGAVCWPGANRACWD